MMIIYEGSTCSKSQPGGKHTWSPSSTAQFSIKTLSKINLQQINGEECDENVQPTTCKTAKKEDCPTDCTGKPKEKRKTSLPSSKLTNFGQNLAQQL